MAKHHISLPMLGAFLALFAVGGLMGGAASGILTPTPLAADARCDEDECDDGLFGGDCETNEDQQTGCDKTKSRWWFDGCITYACEAPGGGDEGGGN